MNELPDRAKRPKRPTNKVFDKSSVYPKSPKVADAMIEAEHGNPVCLPTGKASRKVSLWMCGHERMEQAKATL